MSNTAGTIELLVSELARTFDPLARRIEDNSAGSLLEWLGLRPLGAIADADDLTKALTTSTLTAASLVELISDLTQAIARDDAVAVASVSASLLEQIDRVVRASHSAANTLKTLSSAGGFTPQQQGELEAFADTFVDRLLNRLFVEYLEVRYPQIAIVLIATGAITIVEEVGGPIDSLKGAHTRKTFSFERMAKLFTNPIGLLREVYQWGEPGFDGISLFNVLQTLLGQKFEIPAQILQPPGDPAILEAFGFNVAVNNSFSPPGLDVSLRFPGTVSRSESISESDWQIVFESQASFAADVQATIHPPIDVEIDPLTGNADFRLAASLNRSNASTPILLIGSATGSRLEVLSPGASVLLAASFDSSTSRIAINPQIAGSLRAGKLVISGDGGDSFIDALLSGIDIESNFDVDLTWNLNQGVVFVGSAALEIAIPSHVSVGSLEIIALYLRASLTNDGSIPIELSGGFAATLGPLKASVDRMGLSAALTFPRGGGNLGSLDVNFAFKPPNGVGLSVDAGVVKGGGYLYFDFDREEYAGALELVFSGFLNLKAIGLITTKMPDGSPGFSLLIIITAEFATGIQLGFGFTLLGVGGLIGLNRTMRLQPLAEGVRTGAINSILFPKDVIANAPRIISDLRTIFPPEEGKFLIGPMAKLGWGTPTLISLSLGIIIEIPGNIAILGVLKVALPTVDAPLLVLQVNFIGAIEFDKKRIWFFASLFESRLLFMTLEGEMGLLVAFGDDANFVVSVGGFHPQFNPPPLPFPSPKRIAINYINEPNARIRVMNYFAVTSNTAQLGAQAELFFGFGGFSVQGHMGFDALIQFSPFHFIIEVSASVALKAFGVGVFSISLRFSLEGTNPWRARGTGSISLFFFDISADFDITWGEERNTTLPPIAALPLLQIELQKLDNWRAILPASNNLLVSLRKLEPAADTLVLHPVGVLRISQKAIPLDLSIDKIGNQKTSDAKKLSVTVTSAGLDKTKDAQEQFAIAQFQNMEDASKLSRPAYEPQHGGLELSVKEQQLKSSRMVKRVIRYEEIIIDNNFTRFVRHFSIFVGALFNHFMAGASISKSSLSQSYQEKLQPFAEKIAVQPANYVVAFQATNTAFKTTDKSVTTVGFTSQASANDYMQQQIALDPNMADALHVIPTHEVVTV
jgi:hypothetical protein